MAAPGRTFKGKNSSCSHSESAAPELPLLVALLQEVWLDEEDVQLVKEGEEVTLMDWGNAIVQTISRSPDGKTITGQTAMHHI